MARIIYVGAPPTAPVLIMLNPVIPNLRIRASPNISVFASLGAAFEALFLCFLTLFTRRNSDGALLRYGDLKQASMLTLPYLELPSTQKPVYASSKRSNASMHARRRRTYSLGESSGMGLGAESTGKGLPGARKAISP